MVGGIQTQQAPNSEPDPAYSQVRFIADPVDSIPMSLMKRRAITGTVFINRRLVDAAGSFLGSLSGQHFIENTRKIRNVS